MDYYYLVQNGHVLECTQFNPLELLPWYVQVSLVHCSCISMQLLNLARGTLGRRNVAKKSLVDIRFQ